MTFPRAVRNIHKLYHTLTVISEATTQKLNNFPNLKYNFEFFNKSDYHLFKPDCLQNYF